MWHNDSLDAGPKELAMPEENLTHHSIAVLKPVGSLDAASSPAFKAQLNESIAAGAARILVDLSEVPFIDSSGLGALVAGLKAAAARDGMLVLVGLQEKAGTVFRITQADKLFTIVATPEEGRRVLEAHAA